MFCKNKKYLDNNLFFSLKTYPNIESIETILTHGFFTNM